MNELLCVQHPQSQAPLLDQLHELVRVGNRHGLYDAADWLQAEVNHTPVVTSLRPPGSPESRERAEGGPEYQTHELKGSGSLRQCANCGRWFHNEADPEAADEVCSVLRNTERGDE